MLKSGPIDMETQGRKGSRMEKIVERLRCNYDGRDFSGSMQVVLPTAIMLEAANEIESLRTQLAEAEERARRMEEAARFIYQNFKDNKGEGLGITARLKLKNLAEGTETATEGE